MFAFFWRYLSTTCVKFEFKFLYVRTTNMKHNTFYIVTISLLYAAYCQSQRRKEVLQRTRNHIK